MSRIWDALQKVEELREGGDPGRTAFPDRIRLTPKQHVAIHALLRTPTIGAAAAAAGVSETSLRRWLGKPGFVNAYYVAGRRDIDEAMARLDHATGTALSVLEQARDLLADVRRRAERARAGERGRDRPAASSEPISRRHGARRSGAASH